MKAQKLAELIIKKLKLTLDKKNGTRIIMENFYDAKEYEEIIRFFQDQLKTAGIEAMNMLGEDDDLADNIEAFKF